MATKLVLHSFQHLAFENLEITKKSSSRSGKKKGNITVQLFGNSIGILWEFYQNSLGIVWELYRYSLWLFGNSIRILCIFFENSLWPQQK